MGTRSVVQELFKCPWKFARLPFLQKLLSSKKYLIFRIVDTAFHEYLIFLPPGLAFEYPFKDEEKTALFKDPVRTAL